ncbi:hypothetical protein [Nocardia wallacei]|uniref:hypothetical protein n=1 Tax=Nocardia wallacei TaxID=480035 RepID=UPI002454BE77|nr:hypothetical protein [Nocardia wallacei]
MTRKELDWFIVGCWVVFVVQVVLAWLTADFWYEIAIVTGGLLVVFGPITVHYLLHRKTVPETMTPEERREATKRCL